MNETDSTHAEGSRSLPPPPAPPGATAPSPRRLYRDPQSRIAGVASGIAAYFEIDPVIVRLIWVLAWLTGVGIPAYLVCWVVIPKAKTWPPPDYGEPTRAARAPDASTLTSGLAIIVLAALIGKGVSGPGDLLLPAALIGFGVYLLNQRSSQRATAGAPPFVADFEEPPHDDGLLGRSGLLTPTVLSLLAIGAGVCWALSSAGVAHFTITSMAAGGLVIVGVGLLASLWLGRATALIFAGVGLAGMMLVASAVGPFFGRGQTFPDGVSRSFWVDPVRELRDRVVRPTSLEELQPSYELGLGQLTLDLSQLPAIEGARDVQVKIGVGELRVILPPGPSVEVHGKIGLGEATVLARHEAGGGLDLSSSDPGRGQGSLRIDFDMGLGNGVVSRAH